MHIFIRTDASTMIGTGHVMRCLVLAEDLRNRNVTVTFICRELPGNLIDYIKNRGFPVMSLPAYDEPCDEDWLNRNWETDVNQTINELVEYTNIFWIIIDHYALDEKWERTIRPFVNNIMVIDDLANRPHDCDVLLDQNLHRDPENRYQRMISENTTTLFGSKYLLLRQEFRDLNLAKERDGTVKKIIVSFGGSDPTNETMKAIRAMEIMNEEDIQVDVVIGFSNRNGSAVRKHCEKLPNMKVHYQIDYLAELMAEADLAIGAGGSTTWERCYVGLPAITIEIAKNQTEILSLLSELGAIQHLGKSQEVSEIDIANSIRNIIQHPNKLIEMQNAIKTIMAGYRKSSVADFLIKGDLS